MACETKYNLCLQCCTIHFIPGEYFEPFYLELEFTGKEIEVYMHTDNVCGKLYMPVVSVLCSVSVAYSASIHPTLRTHSKVQQWRNTGPYLLYYILTSGSSVL